MTSEKDMAFVDLILQRLEDLLIELKHKRDEQEAKRANA